MQFIKTILFIIVLCLIVAVNAQKNPIKFTAKSINNGKQNYKNRCVSCHGVPAEGKTIMPSIPDVGFSASLTKGDSELYTILTNGVGAMPGFKNDFTVEERWSIINYIRSFDPKMKNKIIGKLTFPKVDFTTKLQEENKSIVYHISEVKKNRKIPLANLDINIFAKRMFGKIPLSEKPFKTNENGFLTITVPDKIPGDAQGNIEIIAQIADKDTYGEVQTTVKGKLTKPADCENILSQRCLWGKGSQAPIWLLCSYFGILLIIFGGLIFVIIKLIGLKRLA